MSLRAGILIIGSLYWDDSPNRVNWRNSRLRSGEEYTVRLPIRYARQSKERGETYTMVFSQLCLRRSHGLGTGKAIPLKNPIDTIEQLIHEAELLWTAERNKSHSNDRLSANWGCVALLVNPDSQVPAELLEGWKNRVAKEPQYGRLSHTKQEGLTVTDNGFLNIPWPQLLQEVAPLSMDFLFAAATDPTLRGCPPTYPRIKEIVRAWKRDSKGNDQYFWRNCENRIHTYQDDTIRKLLVES